jgi:hypothetical protein
VVRQLAELTPRDYRGIFDYGAELRDGNYGPFSPFPRSPTPGGGARSVVGNHPDLDREALSDAELVKECLAPSEFEVGVKGLKDCSVPSIHPVCSGIDAAVMGHVFLRLMGRMLRRSIRQEARELRLSMKEIHRCWSGLG